MRIVCCVIVCLLLDLDAGYGSVDLVLNDLNNLCEKKRFIEFRKKVYWRTSLQQR